MGIRIPESYSGWARRELALSELEGEIINQELSNGYIMDTVTTWDNLGDVLEYKQSLGGLKDDGIGVFDHTLTIDTL